MSADTITSHIRAHLAAAEKLLVQQDFIADLARRITACFEAGGKLLIFGNGGSAADAQHIAAEFVVRYRRNRKALPAIALTTDTSILTAGSNDFGYDTVFARQIEALGNEGDIVIGISTSGNSASIVAGLKAAKARKCLAIAFTGEPESDCSRSAALTFHAPSLITAHVQECHMIAAHIVCELVEEALVSAE